MLLYASTRGHDTTLVRRCIFQLLPGIWRLVFHCAKRGIRKVDLWPRWLPCLFRVSSPVALRINSLPRPTRNNNTHMHTSTQTHTLIITPNTSRSVNSCRRRQRGYFMTGFLLHLPHLRLSACHNFTESLHLPLLPALLCSGSHANHANHSESTGTAQCP